MQLCLGKKIRELRHRDGHTQEQLAEAVGVTAQAVSRWEQEAGYPDMLLIPSIANYFGVTIDELFGYRSDRHQRIEALAVQIDEMIRRNNGKDVCMDACIALARQALIEYPGNERLILCLASALFRAGYVRHGEYHCMDEEGYSVYDTARHCGYGEWKEAVMLYEKALATVQNGEMRHKAVGELMQLYLNMGMYEKAQALAAEAPDIWGSRAFLRIDACDGKKQVQAYGEALLEGVHACALLMIRCVIANGKNMTVQEKIRSVSDAIGLFDHVCPDGEFGEYSTFAAKMNMLLSVYLWLDGKQKEAFDALEDALKEARHYDELQRRENAFYSAPLVRLVKMRKRNGAGERENVAALLAEEWPAWHVPEETVVMEEMQRDIRWQAWVKSCRN